MDFNIAESEILACAGLCVNDFGSAQKEVLLVGVENAEIFNSLLKFGAKIHALNSSVERDRFAEGVEFYDLAINLKVQKFDLIIDLKSANTEHYQKLLKNNGILIVDLRDLSKDEILQKKADFVVLMPFRVQECGREKCYLFASNKFHPLADFSLQKLDMCGDLQFCNARIYEGCFAMPNYVKSALKGVVRN
ncbi:hypothetical protein [Helicobacter sp. 23-1045]